MRGSDEVDAALAAFGLSAPAARDEICPVWEENWEILTWFLRLERRWIYSQMGDLLRLDDAAILAMFEIYQIKRKKRRGIHRGLLVMEEAAIEGLNRVK